ncbi:43251_t:CDS:2, partial [Gigaspora margarita]
MKYYSIHQSTTNTREQLKKSLEKKGPNVEFGIELLSYKEEKSHIIAVVKNLNNNMEEEIRCQTLKSSWALDNVEIDHKL